MIVQKMKPCPRCKSTNVNATNWGLWRAWCRECLFEIDSFLEEKDAIEAWNNLEPQGKGMNSYDVRTLMDNLESARIYAESEFERLCNNNQHIDACVFQSIRDSIAQNIQLLQSYVICKAESEG